MSVARDYFADFIAKVEGFDQLPSEVLTDLLKNTHPTRYRVGQRILGKERIPDRITIIYEGKVRLLAHDPRTQVPTTLKFLESGEVLGEIGILRQFGCEIAIASSEVTCLTLDATQYLQLSKYPYFAKVRKKQCHLVEIFDVLSVQKEVQANAGLNLKELAQNALSGAKVHYLPPGKTLVSELDSKRVWFVSGTGIKNVSPGCAIELLNGEEKLEVLGKNPARLIGLRFADLLLLNNQYQQHEIKDSQIQKLDEIEIPYASESEPVENFTNGESKEKIRYPFFHGKGELNSAIACFQMVSKHLKMPFRREIINRILNEKNQRLGTVSTSE